MAYEGPHPIPTSSGGTGRTTLTIHGVLIGNAGNSINFTSAGTLGQLLQSGGAGADPNWTTATYPATTTANQILYSSVTNTVTGLATAANGVLVTDGSSVPSISSTLPTAVQGNITTVGTITSGTWHGSIIAAQYGGTGVNGSAAANGTLLIGNGTGYTLATLTAGTNIAITNGSGSITISANATAQVVNYTRVSGIYTASATDYFISCDTSGGTVTVQLPNAPTTGRIFVIKDGTGNAATNSITITTPGGVVNIDASPSYIMNVGFESIEVIFNGTSYEVY